MLYQNKKTNQESRKHGIQESEHSQGEVPVDSDGKSQDRNFIAELEKN